MDHHVQDRATAPVDVLAVIDWQVRQAENRCETARTMRGADARKAELDQLHATRAAMAELIKRGNRIEQRNRGAIWGDEDAVAQDWAEFRAALARVMGGV